MKTKAKHKQYTIRNIPFQVDLALRKVSKKENKSLNQVALEYLEKAVSDSVGESKREYSDLDEFIGSWEEDPDTNKALKEQSKIDKELWK